MSKLLTPDPFDRNRQPRGKPIREATAPDQATANQASTSPAETKNGNESTVAPVVPSIPSEASGVTGQPAKQLATNEFGVPDRLPKRQQSNWRSLGLSFLLHGLLVTILFFVAAAVSPGNRLTEPDRRASIVLAQANPNDAHDAYLDPQEYQLAVDQPAATMPDAAASAAPEVSLPVPDLPDQPGMSFDPHAIDANAMAVLPRTGQAQAAPLTKEQRELIAADQALIRSRAPAGPPTSISVFGSGQLKGRSFLFLLDRSKSMGAGGLGVIQAARKELTQAIGQLEDFHRFQILGYHDRTVAMKTPKLLPATQENQQAIPEFLDNLAAFGATNHQNGIMTAITYQPDVIVLLTDGGLPELNEGQLKLIRRSAGKIQIHCIQFGTGKRQETTNFMTRLAEQNQGSFRYVNVRDWAEH